MNFYFDIGQVRIYEELVPLINDFDIALLKYWNKPLRFSCNYVNENSTLVNRKIKVKVREERDVRKLNEIYQVVLGNERNTTKQVLVNNILSTMLHIRKIDLNINKSKETHKEQRGNT